MTPAPAPGFCLVQGQLQDSVAVADRGLAYGDGLFETMRLQSGRIPAWSLHQDRLRHGASILGIEIPWPELEQQLAQALELAENRGVADGVLKLIVTRGVGGQGYLLPASAQPSLILVGRPYRPMPHLQSEAAVALKTCDYRLAHNPVLAGLKHLNRLEQVLAAASVSLGPADQGLIFDRDNRLIETLHHNIFLVNAGRLLTPDLTQCGVAGVARRAILEIFAEKVGVPVAVEHLENHHLEGAEEVFICNGVHGVTPVHEWNDIRWRTGPVTQALMRQFALDWNNLYGS